MRSHRYPLCVWALLALAGCESHIYAECPPGSRCVVICDEGNHACRVEVDEADARVEPEAQPEPEAPEPAAREPEASEPEAPAPEAPAPEGAEPEGAEPEPPAPDACASLCAALDKDSAACALSVMRAAHPDCERPPVCEDLLDQASCTACFAALGSDCGAVEALCVSP